MVIIKDVLKYLSSLITAYQARIMSDNIRNFIFGRYMSFGMSFFDGSNRGYLQNVLVDFTNMIAFQMKTIATIFVSFFMVVVYIVVMFYLYWKLTLFTIFVLPILFFSMEWIIKKIMESSADRVKKVHALSINIFNILSCIPLVKLYMTEEKEKKYFAHISESIKELEFKMDRRETLSTPMQDVIITVIAVFVVLMISLFYAKEKSTDISSFVVYFYIVKRCASEIAWINNTRAAFSVIVGPILEIINVGSDEGKYFVAGGQNEFGGLESSIEFQNLSFSYRKDIEVLNDINLLIEKNKITALVGSSGSGKTTIVNLILRLYDCPPASIYVDGTDIRNFTLSSLRKHMALVSQDTLLFNDTLRHNIAYGLERDFTDEELLDVAKKSRLYDFIVKLPDGLDTQIGDRGMLLSGGEKQRVSIARALLKGADILMLDEATSALDTKTERLIQEAIDEAIKGKTVIVIAHRLSTIKNADNIIVIEKGVITEEGPLNELLGKKGKFYEYWEEQKFY